jgi:hypothetical protein
MAGGQTWPFPYEAAFAVSRVDHGARVVTGCGLQE